MEPNCRAYHLSNFYLASIQQGIQAAHCQTEMAKKYHRETESIASKMFWDWTKEPTMICLNGGNYAQMSDSLKTLLEIQGMNGKDAYPFDVFSEDTQSLNGLLTNIGIIVPEKIWGAYGVFWKDALNQKSETNKRFESLFLYYVNHKDTFLGKILKRKFFRKMEEFQDKHGKLTHADAKLIDFMRQFALAK